VLLACPPWATMLLVCAMSGVAAYELLHVAGKSTDSVAIGLTVLLAVMQVSWGYLETQTGQMVFGGVSAVTVFRWALVVLLFFRAVMTYGKSGAVPFETVAAAIVGGIVFPAFYGCILLLRLRESGGRLYVLAPFVIAFVGDSLAMYFGKWFGKKKLTPVSPNKTWAGFYGSILGSVLGLAVFGVVGSRWLGYEPNWLNLALLGVVGNLLGQLGDLSTSLIKREHDVKDYSHLFLTHGGMLDRFDSTLFIAPVVYFFVSIGMI
jgi:phosphatidate cytidylyltransferase